MMRCLVVGIENPHTLPHQESTQHSFIARALVAYSKPGAQFSEDDKRQPDFVGTFDRFDDECITAAKVDVSIRVES